MHGSDSVALEAPIVALGLLQHLPEGTLPFACFFVLLLDPEGHLHHTTWDVPITPKRLNRLVVITRARSLVEERTPSILVFAHQLDLLERVLWLPLLHLLTDLANGCLSSARHGEHTQCHQYLHF